MGADSDGSELWRNGALELGRLIAEREVSSAEVVESHLGRIAEVNPLVNAVTRTQADEARQLATATDRRARAGELLGPLDGVPFTSKENLDCLGVPTTEGLIALADAMPTQDAPIVERMKATGAIPLARTNMPDLGLRIHTDNALHGPTVNPWDSNRTCGGSSGGEGVAIATGMSPMGLGNDIGGSVRNPAHCSGIAAHKATPHRLPRAASTPPTSWGPAKQLMSVEGPMARHVADLRAMFAVMHGRHHRDPWSVTTPFDERLEGPRPRIGLVPEPPGGPTDPAIAAGVRRTGQTLAEIGYEVSEVVPPDLPGVAETWERWLGGEIDERRVAIDPLLAPDARTLLDLFSAEIGPQDLASTIDALTRRHGHAQAWAGFFQETPVLIGPVWTQPAFEVGFEIAGPTEAREVITMLRLVVAANVLGLPATSLPVGVGPDGLPLGVQILAEHHRDDLCLAVADDVERVSGTITPVGPR